MEVKVLMLSENTGLSYDDCIKFYLRIGEFEKSETAINAYIMVNSTSDARIDIFQFLNVCCPINLPSMLMAFKKTDPDFIEMKKRLNALYGKCRYEGMV
jgi:hypothetical protein